MSLLFIGGGVLGTAASIYTLGAVMAAGSRSLRHALQAGQQLAKNQYRAAVVEALMIGFSPFEETSRQLLALSQENGLMRRYGDIHGGLIGAGYTFIDAGTRATKAALAVTYDVEVPPAVTKVANNGQEPAVLPIAGTN
jgi:hypothetical protein